MTSGFVYQNYNKQSNANPNKTASIVRNKLNSFSDKSTVNNNNQTYTKITKNNSHSKSMTSIAVYQNCNSTLNLNNQFLNTTSNDINNNNYYSIINTISPAKANLETIDNSNLNNKNNPKNNKIKQTPLLTDMKRYQDKLFKKNNNFEYKKIKNNHFFKDSKNNQKADQTKNINETKKQNYFDDISSYNKLVKIDKLNHSNYLNKANNANENSKNLTSRNINLLHNGFNLINTALHSNKNINNNNNNYIKNLINNNENIQKTIIKEESKRPNSAYLNKINRVEKINFDNLKKKNLSKTNYQPDNPYKANSKEKILILNKCSGITNFKIKEFVLSPNVDLIIKCLKFLKFPKNYIDYYKIVLDKLEHSKNNKFLICVLEDKRHLVHIN